MIYPWARRKYPMQIFSVPRNKVLVGCSNGSAMEDANGKYHQALAATWVIGDKVARGTTSNKAFTQPRIFTDVRPRDCRPLPGWPPQWGGVSELHKMCAWGKTLSIP